ncbi:beta-1,4-glucuronyltransferase 1 [Schistocerca nitens]|uniref:beta-1,4-glucuronyltransferase 1 n=2 Tax=Schistocerca TaxID=7008 RepID=UPI00211931AE|nr:beta-1,4-glucuronyltransferase 1 [Schistocerca nitens]
MLTARLVEINATTGTQLVAVVRCDVVGGGLPVLAALVAGAPAAAVGAERALVNDEGGPGPHPRRGAEEAAAVAEASCPPTPAASPFRDLRLARWDARRLYQVVDSLVPGDRFAELSATWPVCLATQSSLERLSSLVQVAHQWTGPMSVSLFAAGEELPLVLRYVRFLRRCYAAVRERVSFHLVFPRERPPSADEPRRAALLGNDCHTPGAMLGDLVRMRTADTIRWRTRAPYPQNHMRNVARANCQASHVFLTDVDIVPSSGLAEGVAAFLRRPRPPDCQGGRLCAFVVPTYELDERVRFPPNKSELVRLARKGLARPFHQKVFVFNQFATNFSRWQESGGVGEPQEVHVSHNVTNFEFLYEPFYVAPATAPPHDERFMGYGYTRNTQVYEMYVAGYQFKVLSPVFTIHWGLQTKKGRPSWRERQNSHNGRQFEAFKREVLARYGKDVPPLSARKSR